MQELNLKSDETQRDPDIHQLIWLCRCTCGREMVCGRLTRGPREPISAADVFAALLAGKRGYTVLFVDEDQPGCRSIQTCVNRLLHRGLRAAIRRGVLLTTVICDVRDGVPLACGGDEDDSDQDDSYRWN